MYATELFTLPLQISNIKLCCTLSIIQLAIVRRGSISAHSVSCSVSSAIILLQVVVASCLSPASDTLVVLVSFFSEFKRLAVSSAFIFSMLYMSSKTSFYYF